MSCVGPPDPEHGLIENFPVIINTTKTFSFILRGVDYSFEEDYALNLEVETLDTLLLTTIVVTDFVGNDTTLIIQINKDSSSILKTDFISSNNLFLIEETEIDTVYSSLSDSIFFIGHKFTGILEFILSTIVP